jgi:hypothetical protein
MITMESPSTSDLLDTVRKRMLDWEKADSGSPAEWLAAHDMTSAFAALDDMLQHGDLMPLDWMHHSTAAQVLMLGERLARRDQVIGKFRAEVAQLKAQLDDQGTHCVLLCLDRDLDDAALISRNEEPGTILRATDTGRELRLAPDRTWAQIPRET